MKVTDTGQSITRHVKSFFGMDDDDEKATGFPEEVDPAADEGDGFDNFDDLEEASDGAPGQ